MVKSLYLVALELASGQTAEIGSDGNIKFGQKRLSVMHHIEFQSTNVMSYIPLHEIIDGKSTEWQEKVRHSVVILGYDGRNIHSIDTPIGPLTAHRFFVCGLMSLYKTSLLSDLEPR